MKLAVTEFHKQHEAQTQILRNTLKIELLNDLTVDTWAPMQENTTINWISATERKAEILAVLAIFTHLITERVNVWTDPMICKGKPQMSRFVK